MRIMIEQSVERNAERSPRSEQPSRARSARSSDSRPNAVPSSSSSVLVVEPRSPDAQRGATPHVLAVPASPATLIAGAPEADLAFVPLRVEGPGGRAAPADLPLFESIAAGPGGKLLMLTAPGSGARLNGLPAPLVALLSVGDQVELDTHRTLHVSMMRSVAPVSAPAEIVGKPCGICMVDFTAESRVVLCPACGNGRHMEGPEVPAIDRLECAAIGACQECGAELPDSDGLAYWPEVRQ